MTALRPDGADDELHDEFGNHIADSPELSRSLRGKLRRHIARHRLEEPPEELVLAGRELAAAHQMVEDANLHRKDVRDWVVSVARKHRKDGVPPRIIAKGLGVDERTLRDYLEYGQAQHRNSRKGNREL